MAVPYQQVSRDAARALEEFSDEMRSALALGEVEQWAMTLGFGRVTNALKTTFPIPLDAAGYKELKGDIKFRNLYHRSLSMTTKEWSDGVEAKARVVEAPDFGDWAGQPAKMAFEWQRLPNEIVATMLAVSSYSGPFLDFYRDPEHGDASARRLFATDHPCNVLDDSFGTFNNTTTTTVADILNGKFFKAASAYFRSIKGPNGKPLGLKLRGGNVLVPAARDELFQEALQQERLIRAVSSAGAVDATSSVVAVSESENRFRGTIGQHTADELSSDDYFYCIAAGVPGLHPWIIQTEGSPEEFLHDKSSELYKRSRKIGIAYVGNMGAAACLPQPILRVQITG